MQHPDEELVCQLQESGRVLLHVVVRHLERVDELDEHSDGVGVVVGESDGPVLAFGEHAIEYPHVRDERVEHVGVHLESHFTRSDDQRVDSVVGFRDSAQHIPHACLVCEHGPFIGIVVALCGG